MAALSYISPKQTIRQIALAFPACAVELERYPDARRGDRWTLEQLEAFAKRIDINERQLLVELAGIAGVPVRSDISRSRQTGSTRSEGNHE